MKKNNTSSDKKKEKILRNGWLFGVCGIGSSVIALYLGRSTTQLADLIRKSCETLAVFLSWLTFRKSSEETNQSYNYGYGKLENLASLIVAEVIIISFFVIVYNAMTRMQNPSPVGNLWFGFLLAINDFALNSWFWNQNYKLAQQTYTPIMESQWRLYRIKTIINGCVILILGLTMLFKTYAWSLFIDPVGSLLVAIYLPISAYHIARQSIRELLDRAIVDVGLLNLIKQVIGSSGNDHPKLVNIRSRQVGCHKHIELILEFDGNTLLTDIQSVSSFIVADLEIRIPNSIIACIPAARISKPF
ncbi:MAG: hypothetical protein A2X42_09630 [Candidatus Margulisbacteria bacterium GWF2_38_17]|nr:MAG: hypothetical protein A2X42_09630 [Candidatus Margulisbacteria bacterium GWF2_38_17]OGI08535.1 MAG: hypothetical protein A2X41_07415 [Candidatus Margulisbacteria bacterium GWE2_39_32]